MENYTKKLASVRKDAINELVDYHKDDHDRIYMPDQAVELNWKDDGKIINNPEYFQEWELHFMTTESLCSLIDALNEEL